MACDKILRLRLDVNKIKKEWLFQGTNGLYLDITFFYKELKDQYKNNGMITQDVPSAVYKADNKIQGPILGNGSEYVKGGGDRAEGSPDTPLAQVITIPDDLPF